MNKINSIEELEELYKNIVLLIESKSDFDSFYNRPYPKGSGLENFIKYCILLENFTESIEFCCNRFVGFVIRIKFNPSIDDALSLNEDQHEMFNKINSGIHFKVSSAGAVNSEPAYIEEKYNTIIAIVRDNLSNDKLIINEFNFYEV